MGTILDATVLYGIVGHGPGRKRMQPFDYSEGAFVNVINQTLWPSRSYVQELVDAMNATNPGYVFAVKARKVG